MLAGVENIKKFGTSFILFEQSGTLYSGDGEYAQE
jgi:hypothetical protein